MKSITAVTFLGILTCAFASYQPYISEKCQDVEAMKKFQPARFFKGTWYVTHAKNGTVATVCHKYKTKKEKNSSPSFDYGYYNNGNEEPFFQVHCEETNRIGNKQFSFYCELIKGQESSNFKQYNVDLTFIDTDYESFAIFYRCVPIKTLGYADNFLVLHRKKALSSTYAEAKKVLEKQGLCLDSFLNRKNSNCKQNPKF
uniref:Salivary lipocalin n=1 Tax=Triatoma dimidiata TaxID=72491 RepID=D1MWC7_TRIDM|nr:hypothetical protein Td23 similar to salivary lipocalin [Triatoma dimidiata]